MSDSYSPENYALFSPESIHSGRTVDGCSAENPLDLTVGPLDLSLKKRTESTRSSPTSWFLKDIVTIPVPVNLELMKGKKGMVSGGSLMDRAVPLSMVLPLKNMSNAEVNSGNGGGGGAREKERAGKRPRPYICQYCGIGFTIRGEFTCVYGAPLCGINDHLHWDTSMRQGYHCCSEPPWHTGSACPSYLTVKSERSRSARTVFVPLSNRLYLAPRAISGELVCRSQWCPSLRDRFL